jgi:PAS domain S-box-containing protein
MERQSNVLVVDDDEFALRSVVDVLRGERYQVVTAASGSEAIDLLKQGPFDLVLADLKMPEVDGLEVLRQVREIAPQAVVMILTGYASLESAIEALREGAYDYLLKPCSPDELRLKIARGLERVHLAEDRQRAREALRESEARWRSLVENAPDIILTVDRKGRILFTNRTPIGATTVEEALGTNVLDYIVSEHRETVRQSLQRVFQTGEPDYFEAAAHGPYDTTYWYATRLGPVKRDDEVMAVTLVTRDITKQVRAEEALRESEERFRGIFENTTIGLYRTAPDGRILMANPALVRMLGYSSFDELAQRNLEGEGYAPECPRSAFKQRIESEGQVIGLGSAWVRRDGTTLFVCESARAIRDEAGNTLYYEGTAEDITERKRAEGKLRRSYAKLQGALEGTVHTLVSAIELRDPYTAGHQRRVTKLACAIAGEMSLPEEQIEGIRMAGLIHDMGKITVPAEILSKPTPLSDFEYGLIKNHAQVGHDVLKEMDFPWPLAQIVLQHHERLDGSGYPQGLVGEEIMLEARILAVADVVEAMASHRPYRPPRGLDKALEEISQNRGVLYDPEVVDVCLKLFAEERFKLD